MRLARNVLFLLVLGFLMVGRTQSASAFRATTECGFLDGIDGCEGSDETIWDITGQQSTYCSYYCESYLPQCNNATACWVYDEHCDWETGPTAYWWCHCLCEQ